VSFELHHLHIKTPDPEKTAAFYVDNLGAESLGVVRGIGRRLNQQGLTNFLSTPIEDQKHAQHYGLEHLGMIAHDIDSAVEKLTAGRARLLEEIIAKSGRRIDFFEGPDGVQFELIEAAG